MNILNEFNSFFNNIYTYRLPIILTLVLVGSLLLLILQSYLRLYTDFKRLIMFIIFFYILYRNYIIRQITN